MIIGYADGQQDTNHQDSRQQEYGLSSASRHTIPPSQSGTGTPSARGYCLYQKLAFLSMGIDKSSIIDGLQVALPFGGIPQPRRRIFALDVFAASQLPRRWRLTLIAEQFKVKNSLTSLSAAPLGAPEPCSMSDG